jgi:hypothetical protein
LGWPHIGQPSITGNECGGKMTILLILVAIIAVELAFIARSLTALGAMIVMLLPEETYKTLLNNRFRAYREGK